MSTDRDASGIALEARLRDFMVDELLWQVSREALTSDFSLLESELLDSLDILRLVTFVEQELGVRFEDDDLVPENFETVGSIVRLVEQRLHS